MVNGGGEALETEGGGEEAWRRRVRGGGRYREGEGGAVCRWRLTHSPPVMQEE